MIKLKWHGETPENFAELDSIVKEDLVQIDDDLDSERSKLIFHHVFLSKDHDGPLVFVWGEEGDDEHYHCKYDPTPNWKSFDDFDDLEDLDLDKT